MILQFNPTLPVKVLSKDNREAVALVMIDYSTEHDIYLWVMFRDTGEFWLVPSYECKGFENWSLGRPIEKPVDWLSNIKKCPLCGIANLNLIYPLGGAKVCQQCFDNKKCPPHAWQEYLSDGTSKCAKCFKEKKEVIY